MVSGVAQVMGKWRWEFWVLINLPIPQLGGWMQWPTQARLCVSVRVRVSVCTFVSVHVERTSAVVHEAKFTLPCVWKQGLSLAWILPSSLS